MRAQDGLRAEAVEQDQALLVVADVEILTQRPWRAVFENAVVGFDPFARLALWKPLVRRDPRYLIHRPPVGDL